jgi:hypothetical protein
MRIRLALFLMLFYGSHPARSGPMPLLDSSQVAKLSKPYQLKLTTRLSSLGLFSYSGRIISDYPALDFNFNYERKKWGLLFFKAFDLYDHLSDNNFAIGLIYKNFKLSNKVTITPYAGFVLEQTHKIAGQGSDATLIINALYKISHRFSLDNSFLFSNLAWEHRDFDWVNRLRILYSVQHLDVSLIGWHNNCVFDKTHYVSTGLNVMLMRIQVAENVFINTGITGLVMLETSDEVLFPRKNGLMFTVAGVFH